MKRIWLCAGLAILVGGCQNPSLTRSPATVTPASQSGDSPDKRVAVPLLPRMAEHQREQMRDHLAAVQEIVAALGSGDFPGVERSAARIGYSEQMGQMCERMGTGAPGFNAMALQFHHTADSIAVAAKSHDSAATLKAVSATMQTCVGCHAVYRQQIVDEATWERIVGAAAKSNSLQPGKP